MAQKLDLGRIRQIKELESIKKAWLKSLLTEEAWAKHYQNQPNKHEEVSDCEAHY